MQLRLLKQIAGSAIVTLLVAACSTKSTTGADSVDEATMVAGKVVYDRFCLSCHQASGKGAPPMNPPLIQTSFVLGDKDVVVDIAINGMANIPVDGQDYKNIMPGFPFLTDNEIASVLTYVRSSFGNNASRITADEVAKSRSTD